MQTFVGPIGYDSTRVTRPVLRHGVSSGDTIRLLHPERPGDDEDARAQEAITDVERMIGELEPTVSVDSVPTPAGSFEETFGHCLDALDDTEGDLVVILGGGVREIYFPLGLAAVTRKNQLDATLQYSDLDGSVREIELPPVRASFSKNVEATLATIVKDGRASLADLAREVDPSKSTISRHLDKLEEENFVSSEFEGKSKVVEPTERGKIYLRL